tara:strand:+ start:391 stop:567 length:177 start_codon:yes stop_codon:yes gene_type:complete
MPKKAKVTKHVKPNNENKSALDRFTPVIIPEKMSKVIKPQAIFEGYVQPKTKTKTKKK